MLLLCIFSENHNKDMWDIKSIVRQNGHKIDFIESQAVNNGLLRPANYQENHFGSVWHFGLQKSQRW